MSSLSPQNEATLAMAMSVTSSKLSLTGTCAMCTSTHQVSVYHDARFYECQCLATDHLECQCEIFSFQRAPTPRSIWSADVETESYSHTRKESLPGKRKTSNPAVLYKYPQSLLTKSIVSLLPVVPAALGGRHARGGPPPLVRPLTHPQNSFFKLTLDLQ